MRCGAIPIQRFYRRKLAQKGLGKARVAAARKLGIRLWIMLRDQIGYEEVLPPQPTAAVVTAITRAGMLVWVVVLCVSDRQTD